MPGANTHAWRGDRKLMCQDRLKAVRHTLDARRARSSGETFAVAAARAINQRSGREDDWLGRRDSNPNNGVQSAVSYR
jgi:hypothetical protein